MDKLLIIANSTTYHTRPRGIQANHLINELSKYYNIYLITSMRSIPDNNVSGYFNRNIKNIYIYPGSHNKYINKLYGVINGLYNKDRLWYYKVRSDALKICNNNKIKNILCLSGLYSNLDIGMYIKRKANNGVKLISFLSDPIYISEFINKLSYKNIIIKRYENKLFYDSDLIIVPSKIMSYHYKAKYKNKNNNIYYIPHGYKYYNYNYNIMKDNNDEKIIRYIGGLNKNRNPYKLLNHISKHINYYKNNGIIFEFIGRIHPDVKKNIDKYNLPNVRVKPPVSYEHVHKYIIEAFVLLVIDPDIQNSLFLPSKLIEQLPYKKPIIGITPYGSETARILVDVGHYAVYYHDISAFKEVIYNLDINKKSTDKYRNIDKYHISHTATLWRDIIDTV